MSLPNIPDINPKINLNRTEVINLLLTSIGLEEISLSRILDAESRKLHHNIGKCQCLEEVLALNESVENMIRTVLQKEMILLFKLESVLKIEDPHNSHHPKHPKKRHPCDCGCYEEDSHDCGCD